MDQDKTEVKKQVLYLGRWVDREYFRAFVYRDGEQKLANSYTEFEALINSGTWFDSVESIPRKGIEKTRKSKHGDAKSDS